MRHDGQEPGCETVTGAGGPRVRICAATPDDLPAIAALHHASWVSAYRGMVPDAALGAPLDDHVARTWADLPSGVTLAWDGDDRLCGFARLKPKGGWPYVDNLHVAPDLKRGGYGRALMGAVHDQVAAQGKARLWLTVVQQNTGARRFYARMGGIEGARLTEHLLGAPVTTFPVIWTHLGALRAACR